MSFALKGSVYKYATVADNKAETYRYKNGSSASAVGTSLAASAKYAAFGMGKSGNLGIVPIKFADYKRKDTPFSINAHGSGMTDWAFSPHDDLRIATAAGEDAVKVFTLPSDAVTANITEASATITGLDTAQKVSWHPTASDILAVGGKGSLALVNVADEKVVKNFSVEGSGKEIVSIAWSYDGSVLGALDKSCVLSIGDPRTAGDDFLSKGYDLSGVFRQVHHVLYLGKNSTDGPWLVFGLDKFRKPTVSFWNPHNMETPILKQSLDMSSGVVLPFYDVDTSLVYVTMRGSTTLNIFDVAEGKNNVPQWTKTQTCSLEKGMMGGALVAKRALDTHISEIARILVLSDESSIIPHPCKVPRKLKGYDATLYPKTADTIASMSANEYLGNKNAAPTVVDMQFPLQNASWAKEDKAKLEAAAAQKVKEQEEEDLIDDLNEKKATYVQTNTRKLLNDKFATSLFRHLKAHEPDAMDYKNFFFDLRPDRALLLQKNIAANEKFWVTTWTSTGGSAVCVYPMSKKNRLAKKFGKVRGHKEQVSCFDISQHDQFLLATASVAGVAKVWKIPEAAATNGLTEDLEECLMEFQCSGKISRVIFHPYVADVLITCSVDFDKVGQVSFWDLKTGEEKLTLPFHEAAVEDVSFDPGCELIATTSKDGFARIINVHKQSVICKFEPKESKREMSIILVSPTRAVTCGFGQRSKRTMTLWDVSSSDAKSLNVLDFNMGSSVMMPNFDRDTNIVFVSHYGGLSTDVIEIKNDKFEKLSTNDSFSDVRGIVFLPKHNNDVANVEVLRAFRLSKDAVVPMSWRVLRKRTEFFQDDLFPDVLAPGSVQSSASFFDGDKPTLKYVSLKPSNMTPLSKAPAEELTDRQLRYKANLSMKDAPKPTSHLGHTDSDAAMDHFRGMASKFQPSSNRWDAKQEDGNMVDDDEWDDSD